MKNLMQFIKFGIVGVSNTIITFAIYSLLVYFNINYIIANIIGYCAGIANSFVWNSKWVFKKNSSNSTILFKFIIVNLIVLCITTYSLFILVNTFGINKYLSQIITIILGMIINFILNKIWTFK